MFSINKISAAKTALRTLFAFTRTHCLSVTIAWAMQNLKVICEKPEWRYINNNCHFKIDIQDTKDVKKIRSKLEWKTFEKSAVLSETHLRIFLIVFYVQVSVTCSCLTGVWYNVTTGICILCTGKFYM